MATRQQRVLVIDDDPGVRALLTHLLEDEGYAVTETDAVLGAMALVRRVRPHVILLDLGLPYRSGGSLLTELKADPRTADIPVVIISGMPDVLTAERRALAAEVIAKPFDAHALVAVLRTLRRPRRTRQRRAC